MQTANLIHIDADGEATLVKRADLADIKKSFNSHKLKKGEELEIVGIGIDAKRRGGSRDHDDYLETVAKENRAMLTSAAAKSKRKPLPEKPGPADPADIKKADEGKSEEILKIKAEQAKKHKPEAGEK